MYWYWYVIILNFQLKHHEIPQLSSSYFSVSANSLAGLSFAHGKQSGATEDVVGSSL